MKKIILSLLIATLANIAVLTTTAQEEYKAKLPEGIHNINDAKQDIFNLLREKQTVYFVLADANNSITYNMNSKTLIYKAAFVADEILITTKLNTFRLNLAEAANKYRSVDQYSYGDKEIYSADINFYEPKWIALYSVDKERICRLVDDLYFIRKELITEEWTRFGSVYAKYKELAAKPLPSEEQRKYIVQANAFTENKDYGQAIIYFNQALQISETGYPDAYYNMALLYAQEHRFDIAILNMKKYLLLKPDATDARVAQDKIYEWEAGINK
jgi:tetratricopeptide (TPR) repeat protein